MIYLVICYDCEEGEQFAVDICRTAEIAEKLKCVYQNRAKAMEITKFEYDVTEVDVNTLDEVFWTMYPDDLDKFSCDEQCS